MMNRYPAVPARYQIRENVRDRTIHGQTGGGVRLRQRHRQQLGGELCGEIGGHVFGRGELLPGWRDLLPGGDRGPGRRAPLAAFDHKIRFMRQLLEHTSDDADRLAAILDDDKAVGALEEEVAEVRQRRCGRDDRELGLNVYHLYVAAADTVGSPGDIVEAEPLGPSTPTAQP